MGEQALCRLSNVSSEGVLSIVVVIDQKYTNKNSKRGLFIFILFAAKKNRASPVIASRFRYGLSSTFSTKAKAYYERCALIFY